MIYATSTFHGPPLVIIARAAGFPVYLDTWAIIGLARGDPSRRERFVNAVRAGSDLLFSVANAVELTGPKGKTFDVVKSFLDELGPHWVPIELNPFEVLEREQRGVSRAESCIAEDFMNAYFRDRTAHNSPGSGEIIFPGPEFFRLGVVLDWVANSESLPKQLEEFDDLLRTLRALRPRYEQAPFLLDQQFQTFNPSQPATFVCGNLSKALIIESKSHPVKKGDGMDFCHAVMGTAFASFATLDNNWKRRVDAFPTPNRLAHVYSPRELDQMVTDMERTQRENPRANITADGGGDGDRSLTRDSRLVVLPGWGLLVPSSLFR